MINSSSTAATFGSLSVVQQGFTIVGDASWRIVVDVDGTVSDKMNLDIVSHRRVDTRTELADALNGRLPTQLDRLRLAVVDIPRNNAGRLVVSVPTAANVSDPDNLLFGASGVYPVTIELRSGETPIDSAVTFAGGVTSTDQNLTIGGAGDVTISTLSLNLGLGSLTMNGTGTLLLSVANTFAGATINNGTIKIGHNGSLGSGTVNVGASGTLDLNNQTISNAIVLANGAVLTGGTFAASSLPTTTGTLDVVLEGAGVTLAKADTGRLELTGENTYTGATSVTGGGTIAIADFGNGTAASPLGITSLSDPTKLVLSSGSTLEFNGGTSAVTTRSFTIGGSAGIAATGAGTLEFTSASQLATTGEAPALTLTANNAGTNRFAASLVDGNTGLANLAINGTGIWVIGTGANRFKNDVRIEAAAGATIGLENASLPSGATLAVANNATIRWEAGNTTGAKLEIVAGTAAKLNLGSNNVVFSNAPVVASGSGTTANFEKQGIGTLTIGASVNAGSVNFTLPENAGMLSVGTGGSIGNVSLATGSRLGGSGSVGAVTAAAGSTIAPGNSPGVMTAASMTIAGNTTFLWEVQDPQVGPGVGKSRRQSVHRLHHQVHVDGRHVARHFQLRIERERTDVFVLAQRQRFGFQLIALAIERREHRLPDHVLCGHAQAGVELEVLVGLDGFVHLGTIGRGTARRPAEGRLHVRVEHGAHAGGHVVEHMGAQTRNEVHPRFFVPALVEFQFVLQFKHVTLRYLAQWSVSNRPNPSIRSLMPLARRACQ